MWNGQCSPTLINCIFSANSAHYDGGGVYNRESQARLTNCTLSRNTAGQGSGIYNEDSNPILTNCIVWGNSGQEIMNERSTAYISFSDVYGDWPGNGNIYADPLFIDPDNHDYHLSEDSPCIDAGPNTPQGGLPETDIDGEQRVMLGRVDMGADEFNPFAAEFVVVRRERVERTVFEYECEVVLENISRFAVKNASIEMAQASENMTIINPEVSFSDAEIPAGASARSVDTCTFTVDRAEAIDPAGIIWRVTAELADTGAKMEHTLASIPPVGPPETRFEYLAGLAEQWLWVGTPGGIEEDTVPDGSVNLADFAEFAANWRGTEQ